MWRIERETIRMKPVEAMAPAKAARIRAQEDAAPKRSIMTIITTATHILAPEEIPSTKGPAIGLPKKVCSRNPDRARAPPRSAACRIRGMRIFQMMLTSLASPVLKNRILRILSTGIDTLPVLIFKIIMTAKAAARAAKTAA